jgi:hypothetical protein
MRNKLGFRNKMIEPISKKSPPNQGTGFSSLSTIRHHPLGDSQFLVEATS